MLFSVGDAGEAVVVDGGGVVVVVDVEGA